MTTPHPIGMHIPTMQEIETNITSAFEASPAYAMKNANWNNIAEPVYSMVVPNSRNTVFDRMSRFWNEKLYVIYNDYWDKLVLFAMVMNVMILIFITIHANNLNIKQTYVFKTPADAFDPAKVEELEKAKNLIEFKLWIVRMVMMGIPVIVTAWRIIKRTSVPPINRTRVVNPNFVRQMGTAHLLKLQSKHQENNKIFATNQSFDGIN